MITFYSEKILTYYKSRVKYIWMFWKQNITRLLIKKFVIVFVNTTQRSKGYREQS